MAEHRSSERTVDSCGSLIGTMTRLIPVVAVVIAILAVGSVDAGGSHVSIPPQLDQSDLESITLEEAVMEALEHNHQLNAAQFGLDAAKWAHRQAMAQLLPSITMQSNYTRLDDETVTRANTLGREITMYFPDSTGTLQPTTIEIPQSVFRNGYETSISGQLLLLNPAVWNGVSLAGASKDLASSEVQAAIQSTVHKTLRAYIELLRLRSLIRVQEQHVEQAIRNTEQAERLFQVGRYSEADVLRWWGEEAQQLGVLTETRQGLRVAILALGNLIGSVQPLGYSPDSTLPGALTDRINQFRGMNEKEWDTFLGSSLNNVVANNPSVEALEFAEELAKLQHRQSLTAFLPSMTIGGSYGWQNNDTPELDGDKAWAVSATVSVPLFTSLSNYSGHQTTKYQLRQTAETVRDAHRGSLLGAEAARTAIRSAAVQLRHAETSLQSARRGFEIQQNVFKLGRLSNLEWIDANLSLRSAEQGHTSSYYSLVLAIVDYHETTGGILTLLEG